MKTTLEKIFKDYNKTIRHLGYSDTWVVKIEGALKTDTIMELVAEGYQFEVEPQGDRRLNVKFV